MAECAGHMLGCCAARTLTRPDVGGMYGADRVKAQQGREVV